MYETVKLLFVCACVLVYAHAHYLFTGVSWIPFYPPGPSALTCVLQDEKHIKADCTVLSSDALFVL